MSWKTDLKKVADKLEPPTEVDRKEREALHSRLRVTEDYLEVYDSGVLAIDLAQDLPVAKSRQKETDFWERDVAVIAPADGVEDDDMPIVLESVFYIIGNGYGGSLLVQISRGKRRGHLATIPKSRILSFKYKEVPVPKAPLADDASADAYLEQLEEANGIELHEKNLREFIALRLAVAE